MSLRTSVGGRDTVSFISVVEADAYISALPDDPTDWTALSTADKEYRLILAAQVIGMLPNRGRKIYCGQALAYPRSGQGGDGTTIPAVIKEVQAQLAYTVVHRGLAKLPDIEDDASGPAIKSVSLGGLLSVTFATGSLSGGSLLDRIISSVQFPVYMRLKAFLSQFRWGSIKQTDDSDYPTCSTTTSTTTTTSSSSTTTTVP